MIEDRAFRVTLTLRVSTVVSAEEIERDREITLADAIDNAIGMLDEPESYFGNLGFALALPIDGEAEPE